MENEKESWEKGHIEIFMWHCGDDYCNCTQPVVEKVTPNKVAGYPWVKRNRLWEGEYHSEADAEEFKNQKESLEEKAKEYNVKLDEFLFARIGG